MTTPPKGITARQFVQALHKDGFELKRVRGSHHIYRHPDGRRIVVAYHKLGDTFPIGTLKAMLRDVDWNDDDLQRLGLI
jgi:predicted RNA binding protein YcfA (HicA-like mRNA interferase family)